MIENGIEVITSMKKYPFFILNKEIKVGYNLYKEELMQIKQSYINYKKGSDFTPEGTSGDYVASDTRFKIAKTLIDKEARFMFSQPPDINVKPLGTEEAEKKKIEQYQKLINKVLKKSKFAKYLLQGAKDCFIGKRIACLVDFSEEDGILVHFYNSLQFYYETEYGSERLTKFISFETVNDAKLNSEQLYLVNKYTVENGKVFFSCILYFGTGKNMETIIARKETDLEYIPAVIIVNDGTLENKKGVSEMESLSDYESLYSKLANCDVDSERKNMNPVRYTVDMNSDTTENLSSGAGAYWDLKSEQNQNEVHPMIGTLSPSMNHSEPVKTTLERVKAAMHSDVDVPDISQEGVLSGITSFKALNALYFPLKTRCNEKLVTWKPDIEQVVKIVIDLAMLNKDSVMSMYYLSGLDEVQYKVVVVENYALLSDEETEKNTDMAEISVNARSRKSYIKKWRKEEFESDKQIDEELMQIAIEMNMFDTMSMNTQVQSELNRRTTEEEMEEAKNNLE